MPTLAERAIDTALRGAVTAATGGGIAAVLTPAHVGRMTFDSYKNALNLEILHPDLIGNETYQDWGDQVITGLFTQGAHSGPLAILCILLVVAVIWHVLVRAEVTADGYVPSTPTEGWYVRLHRLTTLVVFITLIIALLKSTRPSTMLFTFAAVVVPGVIYLAYYIKDLRNKRPFDTLVYLVVAACCAMAVVSLPMVYGEHAFDLLLVTALEVDAAHEPEPFEQALILDEHTGAVCTVYRKDKLTLRLEPSGHAVYGTKRASIRELASYPSAPSFQVPKGVQELQQEITRQRREQTDPRAHEPNPYLR
jgi:hypothetical protein